MSQDSLRISPADLHSFTTAIFVAAGLTPEHAGEWAKMLVWANLRGTDSHGIIRIPRYIDLINAKSINAAPDIRVERKMGAIVVLETDRAPAAVGMTRAVKEAIQCAKRVRRRLVRGAQHHAHRRDRLFRGAGGGAGLRRHRDDRVRPDDGLSRHAGRRGVVQSDRVRGAARERPAVPDRLLHRRGRQRQDHGRGGPRRENSGRLGPRQGRPRHHRSQGGRDRAAARRRQGRGAVVHDRVPVEPAAVQSAHRAGPGGRLDRRTIRSSTAR